MNPSTRPPLTPGVSHAAACVVLLLGAIEAAGQAAPSTRPTSSSSTGPEQSIVLEAFTVTGSNIRRIDVETPLPISIISREDLDLRAAPTAAELFESLPMGGPLTLSEANVLGADARGDNNALNLRGIGSGNTLVLINGRRMSPHPISQAEGGVPSLAINANQLPTAAIDRVEILRDGASAIYGADAAAGVVNTILRTDYQGFEVFGRIAVTQHGGADEWRGGVSGGQRFNGGRTHVVFTVDHFHRDKLTRKQRDFSSDSDGRRKRSEVPPAPWNGEPFNSNPTTVVRDNDFDNRSATSVYGNFVRGSFDANGVFTGARPANNAGISTSTTPSTTLTTSAGGEFFLTPIVGGGTGIRQTTPSRNIDSVERDYFYDLNIGRNLLPETDRTNLFARAEHELTRGVKAFGEVGFYRAFSRTNRDPAGVDGTDDNGIHVGIDNPYNPFGSRFYHPTGAANADGTPRITGAPSVVLLQGGTGVRPREFPNKEIDVTSKAYRGVVGLAGRWNEKYDWETGILYSRSETRDVEKWNVRESRLKQALLRTDATAFNPFGYTFRVANNLVQINQPYTNPASVVDPLFDDFIREGATEVATWDAKFSGPLIDVARIPVRFALGAEARYESYSDWRPPFHGLNPAGSGLPVNDNDFIGLSPNLNLGSDRNIVSAYAELLLPIVDARNRRPFFHSVEVSAAGRYEKFSDFGDATKPKASLAWRPHRALLLRGSFNESFRAPNLVQTNTQPLQRSVSGVTDDYRTTVTGQLSDGSTSRTVFRQGNATLEPETADAITLGFALEVPGIKGLTITLDYWKFNGAKVIDNLSASEQIDRDEALLDAYTQAQIRAGTAANNINTNSGSDSYVGNRKVTRAPVTEADRAAFAAFNATRPASSQRAPVGRIISVIDDYLNLAGRDLEGYDIGFSYRMPRFSFGQVSLKGDASYMSRFDTQVEEGAVVETVLAEDGLPKFRGNLGLTWRDKGWSGGWFVNYIGTFMDTGAALATGAAGQAQYEALGKPKYIAVFNDVGGVVRYRYINDRFITHNAHLNYRFGKRGDLLSNVSVRVGINNVFDTPPPTNDDSAGYDEGNPRGRMFYTEFTKKF